MADPGLLSYVPRLVRDWATTPDERHRLIEGSLLFVDLTGFTAMTERLAALGRRGAEEVSAIISTTFEQMLTEAYRAGGSLLKFGGDALLLLFEDDTHRNDAAWSAWGIRRTLRTLGTFETPAGKVRLGLTSAIASGPIHVFVVGSDQKELLVAGDTVTELMRLERRAGTGQILMSESVAAALPASIHEPAAEGSRLLVRRPPPVPTRPTLAPSPGSSIDPFVPAAVRHRHATGETTLEHRHIAIGFVGIRGLDDRVRRDPAEAAEALEEVVERTISGAIQHGAWLLASDVAADGAKLIVTAGAPVATGHDEAALLLTLGNLVEADLPVELRIGANHGTVFFGDIGPPYRRTLTVMGDTVNTAARLMGEAPADAILAARSMLASRRVGFAFKRPRQISLRGKSAPLEVVEVIAPAEQSHARDTNPLLGRDSELQEFAQIVASLEEGGRVVEIVGPPGSGRSRFLDAALEAVELRTVRTDVSLSERATAYAVVRRLFELLTGIETTDPDAARSLRSLVETKATDLQRDLPFAARALGIEGVSDAAVEAVDPRFVPAVTATALATLLATAEAPLVVAIDDVHLADASSLDVLRQLGTKVARLGWLLCVTAPEAGSMSRRGVESEVIELGPLDRASATRLIESLTEDDPVSTYELEQMLARAGGSPLSIQEIVSVRRSGASVDHIPAAVEGLAAMRLDQLAPERRRQLELAAVLGDTFRTDLYAELEEDGQSLTEWDDRLLEARGGERVRFANPVIREVVYNRLPFAHRIRLHSAVADELRRRRAPAEELAEHLLKAERWTEALGVALEAGRAAEDRFANMEAIHWYQQALECGRYVELGPEARAEIWLRLGDLSERAGLYEQAQRAFRTAEHLTETPTDKARILVRRSRMLEQLGSYRSALAALTRARRLAPGEPDVVATATARYGGIRFLQGRYQDAQALAREALEFTGVPSARAARGLALMVLDMARAASGESVDGTASQEALAIFEELGELARQARITNNLGMFAFYRGDWDEAASLYEDSRRTFQRIGDEVNASYGANNLAEIWALQGRYTEAEALFRDVRRIWRAAGDRYGAAYIEGQLGLIAAYTGRLEEADMRLRRSIEQFEEIGADAEVQEAMVHRLEVKVLACDADGAREILASELDPSPRFLRLRATLAWQLDLPEKDREVEAALQAARETGSRLDELRLLELSARAGFPSQDPERQRWLSRALGMQVSPVYPREPALRHRSTTAPA